MGTGNGPVSHKDGLTVKQSAFIAAYLETSNASEAYRRSYDCQGSSEAAINVNACKLLKNAKVALRLHVLQERASAKVVLSRSWVLEQLMDNVSMAKQSEDFAASNKALELLGKTDELSGMFTEKSSVTQVNTTTVRVSRLDEFYEGAARTRADRESKGPLQN